MEGSHLDHRDCDVSNLSVSTRVGKYSRMKTRPKRERSPVEVNGFQSHDFDKGDSDPSPEEDTPLAKKRRKVDRCEIKAAPNFTDDESISEELEKFCNFRRFSSRKKKQTDFLGVQYQEITDNMLKERQREIHQQGPIRRLVFPSPVVELDRGMQISRCSPSPSENLIAEEKETQIELLSIKVKYYTGGVFLSNIPYNGKIWQFGGSK